MGYNLTRHVIRRNRPQLDQLYELKESIRFQTPSPIRLAYKIREAIAACGEFEELKDYHEVLSLYTIKIESQAVLAEYDKVHVGIPTGEMADSESDPVVEPEPTKRTAPGALGLVEVLAELIGNEEEEEIYFPNALLSDEDKAKLYYWTENDTPWMYIDHTDKGITVTNLLVDVELLWKPES